MGRGKEQNNNKCQILVLRVNKADLIRSKLPSELTVFLKGPGMDVLKYGVLTGVATI